MRRPRLTQKKMEGLLSLASAVETELDHEYMLQFTSYAHTEVEDPRYEDSERLLDKNGLPYYVDPEITKQEEEMRLAVKYVAELFRWFKNKEKK